ncbi:MAG TPA: 16S rRNA (guanine(966)-N(2))-methyltransferase RsmD [Rhodospirillaceae bacterium]|jgi:16S rRNA (guanine966-N2)-methyltransferase|nr:16S rRNA (guanine(966)-N(2))-methyltransferase RsmD [Rhodospirillaceae bacterium]
MRITSGTLRGRAILVPKGRAVRPTADKVRAAIFDILTPQGVAGSQVLDAFAGSGALALEALSRGAAGAVLLDTARAALALARANVEALGLAPFARVLARSALRPGANPIPPVTLAFLDPPYGKGLIERALPALAPWMAPGCVCVLEAEKSWPATMPEGFAATDRRVYGDTALVFARKV